MISFETRLDLPVGYGQSLMKKLAESDPDSVARLTLQYRMNNEIVDICNKIMYKGVLRCATKHLETDKLLLSNFPVAVPSQKRKSLSSYGQCSAASCKLSEWNFLHFIINPDQPVIFANTDPISCEGSILSDNRGRQLSDGGGFNSLEQSIGRNGLGGSVVNSFEIDLVKLTVYSLLQCGCSPSDIGIISPFRSQVCAQLFETKLLD